MCWMTHGFPVITFSLCLVTSLSLGLLVASTDSAGVRSLGFWTSLLSKVLPSKGDAVENIISVIVSSTAVAGSAGWSFRSSIESVTVALQMSLLSSGRIGCSSALLAFLRHGCQRWSFLQGAELRMSVAAVGKSCFPRPESCVGTSRVSLNRVSCGRVIAEYKVRSTIVASCMLSKVIAMGQSREMMQSSSEGRTG